MIVLLWNSRVSGENNHDKLQGFQLENGNLVEECYVWHTVGDSQDQDAQIFITCALIDSLKLRRV
jgi:hypothetical protein